MNNNMMNACFELGGAIAILNHCRVLYKDKVVNGISILSTVFFTLWSVWNIYFYPSLGQWWSFVGGMSIGLANCLWVYLLVYYTVVNKRLTLDAHRV